MAVLFAVLYVTVAATAEPPCGVSVNDALVIVEPFIAVENVAVTAVPVLTPVAPSAGVLAVTVGAVPPMVPSSVMFASGVVGCTLMSARTLAVICSMSGMDVSPRSHWFEPVAKTSAPLGAVYFVTVAFAEPAIRFAPLFWISSPVTGELASVMTPAGSEPLLTRASHSQPTMPLPSVVDVGEPWKVVKR